jgi:hypothetical protein
MSRATASIAKDLTPAPSSEQRRVLFEYFANPAPETLATEAAIGAAYEEGRALYGDEDGDAWLAALENGTHPLCRVKTAASPG